MNKSELVEAVAKKAKMTKKAINIALDTITSVIELELQKRGKITLVGFGTFATRSRKARTGRNPRTGAKLNIAARTSPVFVAGKGLKESVSKPAKASAGRK